MIPRGFFSFSKTNNMHNTHMSINRTICDGNRGIAKIVTSQGIRVTRYQDIKVSELMALSSAKNENKSRSRK